MQESIVYLGAGAPARVGEKVHVHYTGWLGIPVEVPGQGVRWQKGAKFDSSHDRQEPFSFVLGMGQVISGWDRAVSSMVEGDMRQVVLPPDMAYGDRGSPPKIPPNATLIFDIHLIKVGDDTPLRPRGGGATFAQPHGGLYY